MIFHRGAKSSLLKMQYAPDLADDSRRLRARVAELEGAYTTGTSENGLEAELWTKKWSLKRIV